MRMIVKKRRDGDIRHFSFDFMAVDGYDNTFQVRRIS